MPISLIPYQKRIIKTALPHQEIIQRLEANIEYGKPYERYRSLAWRWRPALAFDGYVEHNGFRITKTAYVRRISGLPPLIRGAFRNEDAATRIDLTIHQNIVEACLYWGILLLLTSGGMVEALSDGIALAALLFPCIFGIFYVSSIFGFNYRTNAAIAALSDLLAADPPNGAGPLPSKRAP